MSAIFISHSSKDRADTDAMAAWLKKQGHTSYFIDYDENSGTRVGTDWEQVLYQRLRQCQAVVALVTPNWLKSKWCFAEMIQAREKGKPIFPVKLESCELPGILTGIQSIDLTVDKEIGYRRLAAGLKQQGLDPADVFVWNPERPPYPGFPAFEEADAAVFFGRSADILSARETFEGLRRHNRDVPRLVLVLGSSGSGKSSLVRAGLIPRLKKDEKNWLALRPFRPQDELNPLDALAFAFESTYKDLGLHCDNDLLHLRLRRAAESTPVDSGELLKIARELASAADHREATVLVTVDQVEELLNSGSQEIGKPLNSESQETEKTFLRFLGASLSAGDRHLMVVATIRSDSFEVFQNQVASLESEYRLGLEHRLLTVEPIPIERYGALIEGPARVAGLELETNLVLTLLRDAGQSDLLPLVAFTLRRLYDLHFEGPESNQRAKLTLREYEELGGLAEAVPNAAEGMFKAPLRTTDEINAFREALIPGLIRYNEDRSYSRQRAFRDELPPEASGLLEAFVNARILVASADKDGRPTVEIAHEALLRTWPTLITWLIEDRDKLRQHNAIVRAAKEWDENGRKTDLLVHRDGRLKDAEQLISEKRFAFQSESVEQRYLEACLTDQQGREAAAQEERERRLRDAQRFAQVEAARAAEAEKRRRAETARRKKAEDRAKKLRRLAVILAVVTLVISVFSVPSGVRSFRHVLERSDLLRQIEHAETIISRDMVERTTKHFANDGILYAKLLSLSADAQRSPITRLNAAVLAPAAVGKHGSLQNRWYVENILWEHSSYRDGNLTTVTFRSGSVQSVNFDNVSFSGVVWNEGPGFGISGSSFSGCSFNGGWFSRTKVNETAFVNCTFYGTTLEISGFGAVRFESHVADPQSEIIHSGEVTIFENATIANCTEPPAPGTLDSGGPANEVTFVGVVFESCRFRGVIRPSCLRNVISIIVLSRSRLHLRNSRKALTT
jgi:uncharacterized protein YjbI with pentapeptide repeats